MTLRRRLLMLLGLTVAAAVVVGLGAGIEHRDDRRHDRASALALAVVHDAADVQERVYRYGRSPSASSAAGVDSVLSALGARMDSLLRLDGVDAGWSRLLAPRADRLRTGFRDLRASGAMGLPAVEPLLAEAHGIVADAAAVMAASQAAKHRLDRRLDMIVLVSAAVLIGALLLAAWWLVERLGRRVSALQAGAMALADGDFGHRVPGGGSDEIGVLTAAFNRMAAEVEGAVRFARLKVDEVDAAQQVLHRRVRQQAAIVELGTRALGDPSLVELEQQAARLLADGLGVEFAKVLACEPAGATLRLVAGVGWRPGLVGSTTVPADRESQAGFTLQTSAPVVVDDFERETRFTRPALLSTHGVRSGISVVVGDPVRPYGVLGAHSASVHRFTADDVAFVQTAANLLAQTIGARTARAALIESERRYQDLYDHAPAMYWSVNLDTGRILACNLTAARTLGYERDELLGESVFDLYAPACHAAVRAGIRTLRERGEVRDQLLSVRRRDGTVLDVNLQATAVRDGGGRVVASRTTWIDVSARTRAEQALRRSRDRLARAERAAQMGHWHYDALSGVVTWSDGHARLFGIAPDAFDGTSDAYLAMVHPSDREGVERRLQRYLNDKRGGEGEYRIVRSDGEVRYLRATAEVAVDADGQVTSLFGTSTDVTDRHRLEDQLRHVVEHSSNLFYTHTADHVLTYVSPQSRDIFDCEPDEALIRWTEFLTDHPDNQAGVIATERAIATGVRQPPYELQLRTARGRLIWVEVRETPLVRDGSTVAIVGALTDVTQRRQAEDALRRERELLDRTLNNVPVMVTTLDPEGRIIFVNRAWEQTLGWSLGECRAHPDLMAEFYPDAADRARVLEHIRDATGEWHDYRTRVRDGRMLDTMWANVRLSDGALIGIGQDITERKAAERALMESEERLRLAVTAANQGLFDADLRTGVSVVSPEYCRMLGYEPDELEVTHDAWLERLHPDDRLVTARRFADYVEGRSEGYAAEFRLRHKDGSWRWILSVGRIVEWDGGQPIRFLGTHTDITARKTAEEEVRASRERLRELAFAQEQAREAERARMARELHDEMGQALTGFKMDLAWLRDRLPAADADARGRAAEAMGLVNVMVDVVRRMSGELRPGVLDDLGLGPAIRWQVREFQRRSGLTAHVAGLDALPVLDAERALAVFRIVQEALTNVARHARAGAVWITAAAADGRLRVEVRDDGTGIPPAAPADRAPLGILGMQERAGAWGGTVAVVRAEPRGTVVALEIPVEEAATAPA